MDARRATGGGDIATPTTTTTALSTPPQSTMVTTPTSTTKVGSWSLDKNKLKKLGIKSSLLLALSKHNKSTMAAGPGPSQLLESTPKPESQRIVCSDSPANFKQPVTPVVSSSSSGNTPTNTPTAASVALTDSIKRKLHQQIVQRQLGKQPVSEPVSTASAEQAAGTVAVCPTPDPLESAVRPARFNQCLSESEQAESGDGTDVDGAADAVHVKRKTIAVVGLPVPHSDVEADDEISDAESQRRHRQLLADAEADAVSGQTTVPVLFATVKKISPPGVHRTRRGKQQPVAALQSDHPVGQVDATAMATTTPLPPPPPMTTTTTTTSTNTTTDDDESGPPLNRPMRHRRLPRNRTLAAAAVPMVVLPVRPAASSDVVLSDNTVDYLVDSVRLRCELLDSSVRSCFERQITDTPQVVDQVPVSSLPSQPIEAVPVAPAVAAALPGIVKISTLNVSDRALVMKLLKSKAKKNIKTPKTKDPGESTAAVVVLPTDQTSGFNQIAIDAETSCASDAVVDNASGSTTNAIIIAKTEQPSSSCSQKSVEIEKLPLEAAIPETIEPVVTIQSGVESSPTIRTRSKKPINKPNLLKRAAIAVEKPDNSVSQTFANIPQAARRPPKKEQSPRKKAIPITSPNRPVPMPDASPAKMVHLCQSQEPPNGPTIHTESQCAVAVISDHSINCLPESSKSPANIQITTTETVVDQMPELSGQIKIDRSDVHGVPEISGLGFEEILSSDKDNRAPFATSSPLQIVQSSRANVKTPTPGAIQVPGTDENHACDAIICSPVMSNPDSAEIDEPLNISADASYANITPEMMLEFEESPDSDRLMQIASPVNTITSPLNVQTADVDEASAVAYISPNSSTTSASFHGFPPPGEVEEARASDEDALSDSPVDSQKKPTLLDLLAQRVDRVDLEKSILLFQRSQFANVSDDDDDDDDDVDSGSTGWSSVRNYFSDRHSVAESSDYEDQFDDELVIDIDTSMLDNEILANDGALDPEAVTVDHCDSESELEVESADKAQILVTESVHVPEVLQEEPTKPDLASETNFVANDMVLPAVPAVISQDYNEEDVTDLMHVPDVLKEKSKPESEPISVLDFVADSVDIELPADTAVVNRTDDNTDSMHVPEALTEESKIATVPDFVSHDIEVPAVVSHDLIEDDVTDLVHVSEELMEPNNILGPFETIASISEDTGERKENANVDAKNHIVDGTLSLIPTVSDTIDPRSARKPTKSKRKSRSKEDNAIIADTTDSSTVPDHMPNSTETPNEPVNIATAVDIPIEPDAIEPRSARKSTKSKPAAKTTRKSHSKKSTEDAEPTPKRKYSDTADAQPTPERAPTRSSRRLNADAQRTSTPKVATKRAADKDGEPEQAKRTRKSIKDYFSPSTSPQDEESPAPKAMATTETDPVTTSRRARGKGESAQLTDTPKTTKLVQKRAVEKTRPTKSEDVTCGNCKELVKRKDWKQHFKFHYGQAWIDGEENALPMEPLSKVGNRMQQYRQRHKLSGFTCHKCQTLKKSGVGYLSHLEICGLTADEMANAYYKCPHCPSLIRTVSIASHEQICHGQINERLERRRLEQQQQELLGNAEKPAAAAGSVDEVRLNNSGRLERQSATKARNSFRELETVDERPEDFVIEKPVVITGRTYSSWHRQLESTAAIKCRQCEFTCTDTNTMTGHFTSCASAKRFTCKACNYREATAEKVADHASVRHLKQLPGDGGTSDGSGSEADVGAESSDSDASSGVDENDIDEPEPDDDEEEEEEEDVDGLAHSLGGVSKKRVTNHPKAAGTKRIRKHQKPEQLIDAGLPDRKFLERYRPPAFDRLLSHFYPPAKLMTAAFHAKHFSPSALYTHLTVKLLATKSQPPDSCLPTSLRSQPFSLQSVQQYRLHIGQQPVDAWQTLPRFGACSSPSAHILYCGAAVQCTEWVPLPGDYAVADEQYLAVVTKPCAPFKLYQHNNAELISCLQMWSMHGPPAKAKSSDGVAEPRLRYTMAIESGPLLCVAFMPSGGYDSDRLAVAAVPTFGGSVRLVALPRPQSDGVPDGGTVLLKESTVLGGCSGSGQVSRICWAKTLGHHTIVAGYVTGMVTVWNLQATGNPLFEEPVDGVPTLSYTHVLFPSALMITQLNLHHDFDGSDRWLAVGSLDKKVKFIDLLRPDVEVSHVAQKSRVTGGVWPLNWAAFFTVFDDAYWSNACGIMATQGLNMGTRSTLLFGCSGPVNDVSFSDWLNAYLFVTDYGEIRAGYCHQLLVNFAEMHRKQRAIISYTDIVPVANVEATAEPSSDGVDEDVELSLTDGIVFCDFKTPLYTMETPSGAKCRSPNLDQTPQVRITAVNFNPNSSAFSLYAVGYEAGFVRVCHLLSDQR